LIIQWNLRQIVAKHANFRANRRVYGRPSLTIRLVTRLLILRQPAACYTEWTKINKSPQPSAYCDDFYTKSKALKTYNILIPFGSLISLVHLSAPLCPQASTLNLLSTCLMVCSTLGLRPISFSSLFLLSSPSPTDCLLGKWIGMFLVVFGVVNLIKCPD